MVKGFILACFIFWGCCGNALGAITNNVKVEGLGNVIGSVNYTAWSNRVIYSFRNIPYAHAPIGDLRFRPPVKITTWNGTLNATNFGDDCPQTYAAAFNEIPDDMNEDCLTLNVFVPKVDNNITALPVIFFIFGGGFEQSDVKLYNPNYLLEEDVILVTTQFRVGPLGLLCLHTDEVPGNVMFLDQIMAMQWVQDNIAYFGGDKDRVTLMGGSSGGASINLHLLSPLARGLFHQAIINSGSALGAWVVDEDPVASSTELGTTLGCNTTDISSTTRCMKNATVKEIWYAYNKLKASLILSGWKPIGNRPVVQLAGDQKFLTDDPDHMIKNGNFTKVPFIGLVVKDEGTTAMNETYHDLLKPYSLWNNTEYLQRNLTTYLMKRTGVSDVTGGIADMLNVAYFPNGELGDYVKMAPGLSDIVGNLYFRAPVYKMVKYNSFYQDSYLCTFDYLGSYSKLNTTGLTYPGPSGVTHGDELTYLFPVDEVNTLNDSEIIIAKRMVQLITSFVKNGKPIAVDVESWPAMSTPFGPYLIIDKTAKIGYNFLDEYMATARKATAASSAFILITDPILIIILILGSAVKYS